MRKLIILIILLIGLVGGILWWKTELSPVNSMDRSEIMFVVPQGAGIKAIASNLKRNGLIRNPFLFSIMVQQSGMDKKIQAGDFRLSPSMSSDQVIKQLIKGTEDVWVTIPEGKRATEIAEILKDKVPNYDDTWETELINHEGFLFPDTYLIPHNATLETVITTLTGTFDEKYKAVDTSNTKLSQKQIVILASLIEREAKHDQDRPIISSVIHNRLDIGMALQIDATVQYALGFNQAENNWWTKELSYADLKINSPYNTYLNVGLPPAPIANPGLKAMQAAADPADTDYLYYITDQNGVNHYAKTNAEHEANIRKYGL